MTSTQRPLINRRNMLASSAGATAALSLSALPHEARSAGPKARKEGPLPFKISLAQWSLHRELKGGQLDNLDFAKTANAFGIDGVEYVNQFFADKARDKKYLAEMKTRAAGEGVWSVLIMIDGEGALGDADKAKRATAVENHKKWVEAAAYLGCHSIRVNAHSDGSYDEQVKLAAEGLRKLSEYADPFGINIIVENHGGLSSNGAWLAQVIKTAGHPRTGTLPDFGNFKINDTETYDRYKGVEELMPFARGVSAKTHDFDAKGNEIHTDYSRMMKIVAAAGYHGYVGIEYEGDKLPEREGILKTKKLMEKVRAKGA
ncbi:MAG: sugar phosphate isomerase/epimerase family protein [Deltaproteobacteria bacterium]|nr:sugar phosphate isomerase/epimerase family protein [Deltaproteobacteria bacterium]